MVADVMRPGAPGKVSNKIHKTGGEKFAQFLIYFFVAFFCHCLSAALCAGGCGLALSAREGPHSLGGGRTGGRLQLSFHPVAAVCHQPSPVGGAPVPAQAGPQKGKLRKIPVLLRLFRAPGASNFAGVNFLFKSLPLSIRLFNSGNNCSFTKTIVLFFTPPVVPSNRL